MEKMLGQDDIDSLFAAARQAPEAVAKSKAELFNFSRAGQISGDQMKAISGVNDFFARNLMHTMGAWLRTQYQVKLVSGEQLQYTEFLDRLLDPTYLCSLRLEPLGALGLLEFDLSLAPPIIDVLLGGMGRGGPVRELTEIEEEILTSVVQVVVRELNTAWLSVGLQFEFEQREPAGKAPRMMSMSEKTLCMSFEIQMGSVQGALNLCLPAVVFNAILRRLAGERDRPRRQAREAQLRLRTLLGETPVGMVLQLPPMKLPARELVTLAPGTILRLPRSRFELLELRVGGLPLVRAHPVRTGEHRGAQIADTPPEDGGKDGIQNGAKGERVAQAQVSV
jgi:flagellar motor switch protein FliM